MPRCRSYLAQDVRDLRRLGMLPDWAITQRQHRLVLLVEAGDACADVARLLEVSRASIVDMLRRLIRKGMATVRVSGVPGI